MSVKIMSLVWESGRYEGGTLLVLLALADWADDEGECWPGVTKLSVKARLKRRQTQNVLRRLEDDGVLTTALNVGRGNQNHYFLNVQKLRLLEKVQSATQKAQSVTENVQPGTPNPLVLDPSVNTHTTGAGADSPNGFEGETKPATERASSPTASSAVMINPAEVARVTGAQSAGFSVPTSAKIARLADRPGAKWKPLKPVGPATFPVPPKFFDSLNAIERRELSDNLNFDRGELPKRVEAWQIDRQEKRLEFVSRDAMKANLRKYLLNCDVNKNQRRAS